jgi:hypothetical protein
MSFRAISIDRQIEHQSQAEVQAAAHEQLFQGLELKAKIEALAAEFTPQVQAFTDNPKKAKKQARRWIIEGLCDYLAQQADYELIFIDESDDDSR